MSGEDFLRRFEKGERYSASEINLRAELHRREHFGQSSTVDTNGYTNRQAEETRRMVQLYNDTGDERLRYEVAGIDDAMYDPASNLDLFKYEVVLKGIEPAVPTHVSKFGVFQQKVADGAIAPAKASGVTQVQVDILETTDPFCDVKDGDCTQLESNSTGGSTIIWPNPPTSTGTQWCVVRIEGTGVGSIWYFELAAKLEQWATTAVNAYRRVLDPSGNAGWGELVTDCTQSMKVFDMALAGFYGVSGANGWAEMVMSDNGLVGIIRGLNCPDACVCGTDYTETAPC